MILPTARSCQHLVPSMHPGPLLTATHQHAHLHYAMLAYSLPLLSTDLLLSIHVGPRRPWGICVTGGMSIEKVSSTRFVRAAHSITSALKAQRMLVRSNARLPSRSCISNLSCFNLRLGNAMLLWASVAANWTVRSAALPSHQPAWPRFGRSHTLNNPRAPLVILLSIPGTSRQNLRSSVRL